MPKWMQFIWITFYNKISIKIGSRFWEYSWKDGIWEEKFGNCVSCQFFWAFLFENASDICFVPASLDQKNMKLGMIHQNKIIRSHFIGKAISLIKTKAAASTDQRLSDRISFCQMLTSTGAVSWFLAINAVQYQLISYVISIKHHISFFSSFASWLYTVQCMYSAEFIPADNSNLNQVYENWLAYFYPIRATLFSQGYILIIITDVILNISIIYIHHRRLWRLWLI